MTLYCAEYCIKNGSILAGATTSGVEVGEVVGLAVTVGVGEGVGVGDLVGVGVGEGVFLGLALTEGEAVGEDVGLSAGIDVVNANRLAGRVWDGEACTSNDKTSGLGLLVNVK